MILTSCCVGRIAHLCCGICKLVDTTITRIGIYSLLTIHSILFRGQLGWWGDYKYKRRKILRFFVLSCCACLPLHSFSVEIVGDCSGGFSGSCVLTIYTTSEKLCVPLQNGFFPSTVWRYFTGSCVLTIYWVIDLYKHVGFCFHRGVLLCSFAWISSLAWMNEKITKSCFSGATTPTLFTIWISWSIHCDNLIKWKLTFTLYKYKYKYKYKYSSVW